MNRAEVRAAVLATTVLLIASGLAVLSNSGGKSGTLSTLDNRVAPRSASIVDPDDHADIRSLGNREATGEGPRLQQPRDSHHAPAADIAPPIAQTAGQRWILKVRMKGAWLPDEYSLQIVDSAYTDSEERIPLAPDLPGYLPNWLYRDFTVKFSRRRVEAIFRNREPTKVRIFASRQGAICAAKVITPMRSGLAGPRASGEFEWLTIEAPVTCDIMAVNCDDRPLGGLEIEIEGVRQDRGWRRPVNMAGGIARVQRESGNESSYTLYSHGVKRGEGTIHFGTSDRLIRLAVDAPCAALIETQVVSELGANELENFQISHRRQGPWSEASATLIRAGILFDTRGQWLTFIRYRAANGSMLHFRASPWNGEIDVATPVK